MTTIEEYMNEGNKMFKNKMFKEALENYSKCLELIDSSNISTDKNLKAIVYSNQSASYYNLGKASKDLFYFKKAIDSAILSMKCDKEFIKAYYRAAIASEAAGELKNAIRFLEDGL